MLLGKGARWSEPTRALRRLADKFEVPFATSPMGRGLLADDHPLCFSAVRGRMLAEADLVLVVGTRLDWSFRHGTEISPQARMVQIHSDPIWAADVLARGVYLQGDAAAALQQLLAGLDAERAAGRYLQSDREWLAGLRARIDELDVGVAPPKELGLLPMSPFEWLAELRTAVRHDLTMASFGRRGVRIERPGEIGPAVDHAIASGVPVCIDVVTNEETALSAAV